MVALASAHTDDSLAYAVVEQGDIHLQWLVFIEDTGIDKVWRLPCYSCSNKCWLWS